MIGFSCFQNCLPIGARARWRTAAALGFVAMLVSCDKPRPETAFVIDSDQGSFDSADYLGQVVYVDFWATWCAPCVQSFPWMGQMQKKYADKGLKVLAVSMDSQREQIRKFTQEVPADFSIGYDPKGELANRFEIRAMPTAVLIDRRGRIAARHLGFSEEHKAEFEEKIKNLLEE